MNSSNIIREIVDFYLGSSDFNGIPVATLANRLKLRPQSLREYLDELIRLKQVVVLGVEDSNPHILRFAPRPVGKQLISIANSNLDFACIYPSRPELEKVVPNELYRDEPYKRELALGEPQLAYRSFELTVLEFYRNDPRYLYHNNDVGGQICISDEYFQTGDVKQADEILLQSFGFSFDDDMNRSVSVFLRYLSQLSSEHQQIWKSRELEGDIKLHPVYFDAECLGVWTTKVSICQALLMEIHLINEMSKAMERQPLFRQDFGEYGENRPRDFNLLCRPTAKEYEEFALLLDKILSDNIDKNFFGDDISFEEENERNDGKVEIRQKGTLRALDEWVKKEYQIEQPTQWDNDFSGLKKVRKARQPKAHSLNDNRFDQKYYKDQLALLEAAYKGVRAIRVVFSHHPDVLAASVNAPECLGPSNVICQ